MRVAEAYLNRAEANIRLFLENGNENLRISPSAEAAAKDKPLTLTTAEQFSLAVLNDIHARDSWRASKAFREHIAVEMAKRCLIESIKRAGGVIK